MLSYSVLFLNKMNLLCLKDTYTDVPCELTAVQPRTASSLMSFLLKSNSHLPKRIVLFASMKVL